MYHHTMLQWWRLSPGPLESQANTQLNKDQRFFSCCGLGIGSHAAPGMNSKPLGRGELILHVCVPPPLFKSCWVVKPGTVVLGQHSTH